MGSTKPQAELADLPRWKLICSTTPWLCWCLSAWSSRPTAWLGSLEVMSILLLLFQFSWHQDLKTKQNKTILTHLLFLSSFGIHHHQVYAKYCIRHRGHKGTESWTFDTWSLMCSVYDNQIGQLGIFELTMWSPCSQDTLQFNAIQPLKFISNVIFFKAYILFSIIRCTSLKLNNNCTW